MELLDAVKSLIKYIREVKEDKTKIAPESWHLRYVGQDLATYLYKNNLALDEYYGA